MATSGTFTYTMTISQILDRCLALAGIVGEGEVANSAQYATALDSLNLMQQQLEVNDIPIWKRDFYEFTPQASNYVTNNTIQYRCVKGNTSAADTEPGVGALSELYWQVDADPDVTPTAWALSTAYITSIEFAVPARFYDILFASVVQTSGNEVAISIRSFESYSQDLNSKRTSTASVLPTDIAFDNKEPTNTGFIFPQPTATFSSTFRIFGVVKPEDAVNVGDNIDMPPRYINMITYSVALDLAYIYQSSAEEIAMLTQQSAYYLDQYKKSNREFTSTKTVTGAY